MNLRVALHHRLVDEVFAKTAGGQPAVLIVDGKTQQIVGACATKAEILQTGILGARQPSSPLERSNVLLLRTKRNSVH